MKINSRIFGEIEIEDDKILSFETGLMGFEDYHCYAIAYDSEKESKNGIMWLQSTEREDLAFPVIDPMHIDPNYNPIVEDEWLKPLGDFKEDSDLYVLTVLTVPSDLTKMTVNLKAPIIINTVTKKACQLIVNNEDYSVRYNVYEHVQKMKEES